MSKKILIITRDFTPYCSQTGWMVRMVSLANFLTNQGYTVEVIATKRKESLRSLNLNKNIKVHWVRNHLHYSISKITYSTFFELTYYLILRLFQYLKKQYVIDHDDPVVFKYRNKLKDILSNNHFDSILISTPPHSLYKLVPWIKENYPKINIISDFRDGWTCRPMYKKRFNFFQNRAKELESEIVNKCDTNIFVSFGMEKLYKKEYPDIKSLTIENGYTKDEESYNADDKLAEYIKLKKNEKRIVLGYIGYGSIGNLNGHKDLTRLIRVIASNNKLKNRFTLVLQGNYKKYDDSFLNQIDHLELASANIEIAHANMRLLDLGITVFTVTEDYAPAIVSAKTYEYIYCDIPVFGLAPKNAISLKQIINDTNGYYAYVYSDDAILECLNKIINDFDNKKIIKPSSLNVRDKYDRQYIYNKFLEVL